jgi:hypothetical protein
LKGGGRRGGSASVRHGGCEEKDTVRGLMGDGMDTASTVPRTPRGKHGFRDKRSYKR